MDSSSINSNITSINVNANNNPQTTINSNITNTANTTSTANIATNSINNSAYITNLIRIGDNCYNTSDRISSELFSLTYGSLVVQLLKDYHNNISIVNNELERIGYNIGNRIIEEFLSKSNLSQPCNNFNDTIIVIAKVAFKMFLGITINDIIVHNNNTCYSLIIKNINNPLYEFVEIPTNLLQQGFKYNNILTGVIKGALQQIQLQVDCEIVNNNNNLAQEEIKITLKQPIANTPTNASLNNVSTNNKRLSTAILNNNNINASNARGSRMNNVSIRNSTMRPSNIISSNNFHHPRGSSLYGLGSGSMIINSNSNNNNDSIESDSVSSVDEIQQEIINNHNNNVIDAINNNSNLDHINNDNINHINTNNNSFDISAHIQSDGTYLDIPVSLRHPDSNRNIYTWREIRTHSTKNDCWLVVSGRVFDVTAFLPLHPAGMRAIVKHAGTDATVHFDFHSEKARKLWKSYEIGILQGYQKSNNECNIM